MAPVLLHDRGTGQKNFTLSAIGHFLVGAGLDNFNVSIGEGQADGAFLVHMGRRQTAGRDGLRGAVALPNLNGGFVVI